jgi:hypothetical protein
LLIDDCRLLIGNRLSQQSEINNLHANKRLLLLPPVMRESLIGFGHAVNVFFLLDGGAFTVGGVQ